MVKMTLVDGADRIEKEGRVVLAFVLKQADEDDPCRVPTEACVLGDAAISEILLAAYIGLTKITAEYTDLLTGENEVLSRIAHIIASEICGSGLIDPEPAPAEQ